MRYAIYCGRRAAAWRSAVVLAVLGLTIACRRDDPVSTAPRVVMPSGPLISIAGATVTGLPFVGVAINDAGQVAGTQNPTNPQLGLTRAMLYSGATLLYDTQPGAAQDAPVTTKIEGGNIRILRG